MKLTLSGLALIASLLALVSSAAFADSYLQFYQPTTGTVPLGSYSTGSFDTVSLASLNVHFSIPVFSRPGVGIPFSYSLGYDSLVWGITTDSQQRQQWSPVPNWGWRAVTEATTGYVTYQTKTEWDCYYHSGQYFGGNTTVYAEFSYHDPAGGSHLFPRIVMNITNNGGTGNDCPAAGFTPIQNAPALDNSGYILSTDASTATVNARGGLTIQVPPVQSPIGAGSVTDVNGNRLSVNANRVIADTLGSALTVSGNPPANPPSCTPAVTYTYSAPAGPASFTVGYKAYTVQTSFGVSNINEYPATGQCLVDTITLPDTSYYKFSYEGTYGSPNSVTGRIAEVRLPTGGAIDYSYIGAPCHYRCNAMMPDGSPSFMFRTLDAGTSSYYRGYQSGSSHPTQTTTAVVDPAANETDMDFSGMYQTHRIAYQGSSAGNIILDHSYVCYNLPDGSQDTDENQCIVATVTPPITWTAHNDALNSPTLTQTTLYDGTQDYYDTYGNVTLEQAFDFGSHQTGHTLLKQISTTYKANLCALLNECDRPDVVKVLDGSGNTKARTNYSYDAKGNTIQLDRWVSGSAYLTSRYSHSTNGALQTATDPNGSVTRYDSTGYSCSGAFPNSVTVPSQFVGALRTSYAYNCTGGVVIATIDPNGAFASTAYTESYFWRPASTRDQLGSVTYYNYFGVRNAGSSAVTVPGQIESVMIWNGGNSTADNLVTADAYGRLWLQQKREGPNSGSFDTVQEAYDSSGRVRWLSRPFSAIAGPNGASGGGIPVTGYAYDALGRYTSTFLCNGVDCNGASTSYSYNLNDVVVTLGPGQPFSKELEYNGLGKLTSVCEMSNTLPGVAGCGQHTPQTGYLTTYQYDALSNLVGVGQSGQTRSFTYDGVSRTLSETNPESGTTSHAYDADGTCGTYLGDEVKRVDAAHNVTCYAWDSLHRLLNVNYVSGPNAANSMSKEFSYDVNYGWDGISLGNPLGRLTEAHTCCLTGGVWTGWEMFGYDARGVATDFYAYDHDSGSKYHTVNAYFPNGAVASRVGYYGDAGTNAFSNTLVYSVDGKGRYIGLTDQTTGDQIWNPAYTSYNPADQPDRLVFNPSGDDETFTWGDLYAGRMTNWRSDLNTIRRSQNGSPTWNPNGTLQQLVINDTANLTNNQTCTYGYDDLARLTSSQCGSVWEQNFSYDAVGNIWKTGSVSFQPTSYTNNHINLGTFSYDGMGNVTNDMAHTFSYDAEGRPVQVDGTTIRYDAFNRPFERDRATGQVTDIIYAPDGYKFAFMSGATPTYMAPLTQGVQAVYVNKSPTPVDHWRHSDWLGSARMISTRAGTVYYDGAYAPFGEPYAQMGTPDLSFTGQTQDTAPGDYEFPYRHQSFAQGRFQSPDPAGFAAVDIGDPQTWNRYVYVGNNPLTRVDPWGLQTVLVDYWLANYTVTYWQPTGRGFDAGAFGSLIGGASGWFGGRGYVGMTNPVLRDASPDDCGIGCFAQYSRITDSVDVGVEFTLDLGNSSRLTATLISAQGASIDSGVPTTSLFSAGNVPLPSVSNPTINGSMIQSLNADELSALSSALTSALNNGYNEAAYVLQMLQGAVDSALDSRNVQGGGGGEGEGDMCADDGGCTW